MKLKKSMLIKLRTIKIILDWSHPWGCYIKKWPLKFLLNWQESIYGGVSFYETTRLPEHLHCMCPYLELYWSAFLRIRIEYREILHISVYSAWMLENVDQNNSKFGHSLRSNIFLQTAAFVQNYFRLIHWEMSVL